MRDIYEQARRIQREIIDRGVQSGNNYVVGLQDARRYNRVNQITDRYFNNVVNRKDFDQDKKYSRRVYMGLSNG